MDARSAVFVVGIKTREGLQCYGGPTPREDEALKCYCAPGARLIYYEGPNSEGIEAWHAVNRRWERSPGWTPERQARRAPAESVQDFNSQIQMLGAHRESRLKGTSDHLR